MKIQFKRTLAVFSFVIAISPGVFSQQSGDLNGISLRDLGSFRPTGKNWVIASNATADPSINGDMKAVPGEGALVNLVAAGGENLNLLTRDEFGDAQLELDFMMAKGSNSGVYLQGRYEVQLFDSWTLPRVGFSDCGGIYQRWDDARGKDNEGYEGSAPLQNASRAPGLWQHLKIIFRAPRFDEKGVKIGNARFDEVYLNGSLVQSGIRLTGPTRAAFFKEESAKGPLMLQGDHGNVAFRNIRFSTPVSIAQNKGTDDPIMLDATGKPYLLRSYLMYGDKKLTHVISYGHPNKVNYSYDLKQGALFQIWRGDYLDVTEMWHERGEPQLAKPRGSLIVLNDAPAIAVLPEPGSNWPDSIAFDDFRNQGYTLDVDRTPTFQYSYKGINVSDKISGTDVQGIKRELTVKDPIGNLYCRVATGKMITPSGKNMYVVGDRDHYIRLDDRYKPVIRTTATGKELLVPIDKSTATLSYSIIF